ncbi:hypothetical protein K458DRAFT_383555 [Lentithecium fluviatile CBS 122367]|uniref:Uncharacterized protein n=1 Tax=Lentithecium fluviatile CBS 122367 TaxID=1168545 RepID=A0A6G1JIZ7_9PLEO|nr:hypothetical protein K458DRAFT_383555 [Lentithecium fluviatile CBS 122367]
MAALNIGTQMHIDVEHYFLVHDDLTTLNPDGDKYQLLSPAQMYTAPDEDGCRGLIRCQPDSRSIVCAEHSHSWIRLASVLGDVRDGSTRFEQSGRASIEIWAGWARATESDRTNLKWVFMVHTFNGDSLALIKRVMTQREKAQVREWPGEAFDAVITEEGRALLGSPNGVIVGNFLAQHKAQPDGTVEAVAERHPLWTGPNRIVRLHILSARNSL